jgi:hypothetical protein
VRSTFKRGRSDLRRTDASMTSEGLITQLLLLDALGNTVAAIGLEISSAEILHA